MKKNVIKKIILATALSLSMIVPAITFHQNCFDDAVTSEAATIKLNKKALTMNVGDKKTLKVIGTSKKPKWSVSSKFVAKVDNKGKITAVGNGTTYVYAKIGKTTLECRVTVKFDAAKAKNKIESKLEDTGRGVVAILKNKNNFNADIEAKLVYFKNGSMIGSSSDENYSFESGKECALFFDAPVDSDYHYTDYDDYKISIAVSPASTTFSNISAISIKSNMSDGGVTVEAENTSKSNFNSVKAACVMYDLSNHAIGYEERYLNCDNAGDIDYLTFSFPDDENYDPIIPHTYKIYVNGAYKY